MPLSERKKAHQDDAPQSVHNLTEVSKNAFGEPFLGSPKLICFFDKNNADEISFYCIFAVRGFIDSLRAAPKGAVLLHIENLMLLLYNQV